MNWQPLNKDDVKWLGIDFDDTIASNSGYPSFTPGEPLPGAVLRITELDKRGYKIVIYTARHWSDYHNIEKYCEHYQIPVRRIICGKPLFKYIVDDKNIEFNRDWDEVVKKIC